jgi:NMD protein affecting ribosome stability and mRNA decay
MKNVGNRGGGKQRVRDLLNRRQRSHSTPVAGHPVPAPAESTLCVHCGAVYRRKTWRRSTRRAAPALLGQAPRGCCPACRQIEDGRYFGRVLLQGPIVSGDPEAIRRRVANVAARARFTQPERRVVSVRPQGDGLEVLTTSEKLAHRIVREMEKAFGGRASYTWSNRERSLLAVWHSDAGDEEI